MQENRSFDHTFGTLRGVRGFNDPRAVTLPNQNPVWLQTNEAGETYAPFWLDLKNTKATWLGSLPHSWPDQTDARNHGNHDRWLDTKASHRKDCAGMPFTMGYYDRADIPFYYALADAFTVCDQNFSSTLTGTTPNRLHLWTGTIRAKQESSSIPNVRNSDVDFGSTANWKTFPERLEEAGISWRIYQNELSVASGLEGEHDAWLANFSDNPLEWFDQYKVGFRKTHLEYLERMAATLPAEIEKLRAEGGHEKSLAAKEKLLKYVNEERTQFTQQGLAQLSEHERNLHQRAFTTNEDDRDYRELTTLRYQDGGVEREMAVPKSDPLYRFRKDVNGGVLPTVSWLIPSERFSDHPGSAWYGGWYVAETLNILTRNPKVWSKTIFILCYDENDGYFDHVPPFVAPDPQNPETGKTSPGIDASFEYLTLDQDLKKHSPKEARGGPVGLGYRVPLIVASPWSRGGYVCSQVFDHTSILQLLERVLSQRSGKDIRETNITAWRRAVCGDLSAAFQPYRGGDATVPAPSRDTVLEQVHRAQFTRLPSGYRKLSPDDVKRFKEDRTAISWMPKQEPGIRPSSPLPYELEATGGVTSDGKRFEIALKSGPAGGAPFHVYAPASFRGDSKLRTRAYAVAAGDRLTDAWDLAGFENGRYHLCVCGPNGFLREFAGHGAQARVRIDCKYRAGDLELSFASLAPQDLTLEVKDLSYGSSDRTIVLQANTERSLLMPLGQSHHWYDFMVTIAGVDGFLQRFSGRVETGKAGFSDPAMGAAAT
ncbi:MAG TPA: phospholipase C, phosphocholine-specific, partial [Bryobacteraceae bacterium]|nr:phospholipase C, phosphocholine-specific [Bryobacteraceae bacterium]